MSEASVREVIFTERPDVLITAECDGLTLSWLRGEDDDAETERQKAAAIESLKAALAQRYARSVPANAP